MSQALCLPNYDQQPDRIAFFQKMILNGLTYWQEHAALQNMDIPFLDKERESILSALHRGLEFDQAWPLALKLIDKLAAYMERRGYWTAWRAVLEKAIATSQRVGDIQGETTMTALLARLSQRQGRGEDVVRNYRRAMRLAKQSDNQYEYARACCNLGYYYIDVSRWWRAEVLSLRALALFETLGSLHGLAHTHNHLGVLHTRQRRFLDALANLEAAEKLCSSMGNNTLLPSVLLNMGIIHRETHNHDEAIEHTKQAEKLFQLNLYQLGQARALNNLGIDYSQIGSDNDAIACFEDALKLFRALRNRKEELNTLTNLLNLKIERNEWDEASTYLREIKVIFEADPFLLTADYARHMQESQTRIADSGS